MDHLKMPIAKEETSDNSFPNIEEESDEIETSSLQYQLPDLDLLRDVGNDETLSSRKPHASLSKHKWLPSACSNDDSISDSTVQEG